MNVDTLMQIGVDAAAAFVVVNIVNWLRQGWILPAVGRWLKAPRLKREKQARIIGLAGAVSVVVCAGFALRASAGPWQATIGEWISRALISWVLALGQFDVVRLVWPKMFDPGKEEKRDEGVG